MIEKIKFILPLILLFLLTEISRSEDKSKNFEDHQINFHTGMFDYSDDGQRAGLFGLLLGVLA